MDFEVSDFRNSNIIMGDLTDVDGQKTFYYDETNNIRSYHLKKGKFNELVQTNFVLGGIVLDEGQTVDISGLFNSFNLQDNIEEVKLSHLAKGAFIDCLKSPHLRTIFDFLINNKVYIHYSSLNFLYFSVVDIIDSLCEAADIIYDPFHNRKLKNDLYVVVKGNMEVFQELFYKYKYPNLNETNVLDFIDELIEIFNGEQSTAGIRTIRMLLNESKKSGDLVFIMNDIDHQLITNFTQFYARSLYLFINSRHILDEEDSVEVLLNKLKMTYNSNKVENFSFVDSKDNQFIQLSDIIIGLIGKYFKFMNDSSPIDIFNQLESLNDYQKITIKLFDQLLDLSKQKNRAYIHQTVSNDELNKMNYIHGFITSNF